MSKVMILSIVIVGFIILTIGLYYAFTTFKPSHFNLLAGLIAVIIGAFALFGKHKQDKSSSEKSDRILQSEQTTIEKIDSLKLQNYDLTLRLEKQLETVDNLRRENADLHSKLANVSDKIYSKIIGGRSYCVLEPIFFIDENPQFRLSIVGKDPLKDVQILITDKGRHQFLRENLNYSPQQYPEEYLNMVNQTKYSFITNLHPNVSETLPIPIEKNQKDINLLIRFYQDNGVIEETLRITNFRSKKRKIEIEVKRDGALLPLH